jgi:hypothetical protein
MVVMSLTQKEEEKTVVVEFDRVGHREIIRSPKFLSLLVNELITEKSLKQVEKSVLCVNLPALFAHSVPGSCCTT